MNNSSVPAPSFFKGVRLIDPQAGVDAVTDILVTPQGVQQNPATVPVDAKHIDGTGLWAMPGLVDIQVHFRQPGFEYKETIDCVLQDFCSF